MKKTEEPANENDISNGVSEKAFDRQVGLKSKRDDDERDDDDVDWEDAAASAGDE